MTRIDDILEAVGNKFSQENKRPSKPTQTVVQSPHLCANLAEVGWQSFAHLFAQLCRKPGG